ncbi:MAG: hypothetical protein P8013_13115 [Candidatus Sulfobium sp.]|jgi:hypothetical protein
MKAGGHGAARIVVIRQVFFSLAVVVFLLASELPAFSQALYSRKAALPPLLLTYGDIQKIMDSSADFVSKANGGFTAANGNASGENILVSDSRTGIRMSGHSLLSRSSVLPKTASGFSYTCNLPKGIITDVEMVFSGASRNLYVAGYSAEKVEALFVMLERSLLDAGAGGVGIDAGVKKFIAKFLFFTSILSALYCILKKRPKALGMPLFSLAGLVLLYTLPFDLAPAFTLYSGEPPFTTLYGPQISLAILALVIAGIPLSYFLPEKIGSR